MTDQIETKTQAIVKKVAELTKDEPIGRSISTMEGKARILDLIQTTLTTQYTVNGVPDKLDEHDNALLIAAIFDVIKRNQFLTLSELQYVFSRGLTSEYGEMTHFFNANNVNIWIRKYIDKERSGAAKAIAQQRQQDYEKPEPTEEEKQQVTEAVWNQFVEWIHRQHAAFKEAIGAGSFKASDIDDHPAAAYYYKKMVEKGLLDVPTAQEKKDAVTMYIATAMVNLKGKGYKPTTNGGVIQPTDEKVQDAAKSLAMMHFIKKRVYDWFVSDVNLEDILS